MVLVTGSKMLFFLFLGLTIIVATPAAKLPDGVKLCHRSDPNFQSCVAKNMGESLKLFANGSRELGIPALEPYYIEELAITGVPGQSVAVTQKYRNVYLHGATESELTGYFKLDIEDGCSWVMDIITPMLRMEADYEMKGQLLFFLLNSHGKSVITQFNLTNRHTISCEKYTKKNKEYIRITNYTMDIKPEKVVYDFDNLFPGDEQISKGISTVMNDNAMAIFNDLKGGFEELFSSIYLQSVNAVFSKIPLQDVFLD